MFYSSWSNVHKRYFFIRKLGGSVKNWKETNIENNVLIGSNSTILPVRIVSGCVIGAGSVVTKNCTIKGIYAKSCQINRKL